MGHKTVGEEYHRRMYEGRGASMILLCAELLWPVLMMMMAVILRQVTLPANSSTCRFAARALPSAGLLPFLQSYICNAEDECLNETQVDEPMYQDAAINRWVTRFNPLIQDQNLSRVLRDLPHTMGLLRSFQESLASSEADILNKNLTLRDFLKETTELENFVVNENGLMSTEMFHALIDSALNISKLLELGSLGDNGIGNILCDPTQLQQYINLPTTRITIENISASLCAVDPQMYTYITEKIKKKIDFSKVIKMSAKLTSLFGDFEISDALNNVSEMLKTFDKLESFANMSTITDSLTKLGASLPDLWRVLSSAQSADFDFDFVMSVIRDVQLMMIDSPGEQGWNSLNDMVFQAKNMLNWVRYNWNMQANDISLKLEDLFSVDQTELVLFMKSIGSNLSNYSIIAILESKVDMQHAHQIASLRSPDDLKALLCGSDPPDSVKIIDWNLDSKRAFCTEPMITMVVSKFSLKHFMKKLGDMEEASEYRTVPWSEVSKNVSSLSNRFKDDMQDQKSVLSQTVRFAQSVRLDPIWRSAKKIQNAGSDFLGPDNDFAVNDLDRFMIKLSQALWGVLDSSVGQDMGWWKRAKDTVYKTSVMYDWMTFAMKLFPTERITFGGMFTRPVTMDEFVSTSADYLPTVLEAQMSAVPTSELDNKLAQQPDILQQQSVFCGQDGGPGFSGLFKFSSEVDMYRLGQIQSAVCRLNPDLLFSELRQAYEFDRFMSRYNSPPSYSPGTRNFDGIGNYTFYGVYLSGSQLKTATEKTMDRWRPWFDRMDISWSKLINMMETRAKTPTTSSATPLSFSDALIRSMKNTKNSQRMSSILYDVSKSVNQDLDLLSDLTTPTTLLGQFSAYDSAYAPYVQIVLLETLGEPQKIQELIKAPTLKDAFCGPSYSKYFATPVLPANLDWNSYRKHLCSLNITDLKNSSTSLFSKKLQTIEALDRTIKFDKMQAYPSEIDWSDFSRTLKSIENKISGMSSKRRRDNSDEQFALNGEPSTLDQLSKAYTDPQLMNRAIGKINNQLAQAGLQYYANLMILALRSVELSQKLEMEAAATENKWSRHSGYTSNSQAQWFRLMEQTLTPLDISLTDWNMQMDKGGIYLCTELEDTRVTLQQMFPNASAWQELMRQGLPLVDDLLIAAKNTIINPEKFIESVNKKVPVDCQSIKLDEFLILPPVSAGETDRLIKWMCSNLDVLNKQLGQMQPQQKNSNGYSPQKLDWSHLATEMSKTAGNFQRIMDQPFGSQPTISKMFPEVPGFQPDRVESAFDQVIDAFKYSQADSKRLTASALDALQNTFNRMFDKNPSTATMWQIMKITTLYVTGYAKGMTNAASRIEWATNTGQAVSIEDIYSSPELKSASESLKILPGVVEYFMTSMSINPIAMQKLSKDLSDNPNTWDELCTNVTVFVHYFPKHEEVSVHPIQAQAVLCPRTDSNKLAKEQKQLYPEIYRALDSTARLMSGSKSYPVKLNFSDVYDSMEKVGQLSDSMKNWMGRVRFSNDPIFDPNQWNSMFDRLSNRLGRNSLSGESMSDFSGLLITSVPIFDRQMENIGLGPTVAAAEYFSLKGKQKLDQLAAQGLSLNQSLQNYPQLRSFMQWMDDYAVDMTETLVYTWAEKPNQLQELIGDKHFSMKVLQRELCASSGPYRNLISPPQRFVNTELMVRRLCSLDMETVLLQAVDWLESDVNGSPQQKLENLQNQFQSHYKVDSKKAAAAVSNLFTTYSEVSKMNPNIAHGLQMNWMQKDTWTSLADRFRQYVVDGKRWYLPFQLAGPLYDAEINQIPEMNEAMTMLNLIAKSMSIEVALYTGQIDALVTSKSAELTKLKPIMDHGIDVARMLINSQNKLESLVRKLDDSGDAFIEFCQMKDVGLYLEADPRAKISPKELQKMLCSVDYMNLQHELAHLQGQYVNDRMFQPTQNHLDSVPFKTYDLVSTSRHIGDLLKNSQLEGDGQFKVLGGTFDEWFYLLDESFKKQMSGSNLYQVLNADVGDNGGETTMENIVGAALSAATAAFLPAEVQLPLKRSLMIMNKKLDILQNRPTLAIDDLFPKSPYTAQALRQILPVTPQLFDALLSTSQQGGGSVKLQGLGKIQSLPQAEQMICARGSSLSQYLAQPDFSEQDWRQLQSPICFVIQNYQKIRNELENEWSDYELNDQSGTTNSNNEALIPLINRMNKKIGTISKQNVQIIGLTDSAWQKEDTWENVLLTYQKRQTEMNDLGNQIYNQLNTLDSSNDLMGIPVVKETANQLNRMLQAINGQLEMIKTKGYRPSLTVQDLVPNTYPILQEWLQSTLKLSPHLADTFIRSKVKDLNRFQAVITNPSRYDVELCKSGRGMTDLIQFPPEVNPQEVNAYFCGTNWEIVAKDLQKYFDVDFDSIIRASMSSNMQNDTTSWQQPAFGFNSAGRLAEKIANNIQNLIYSDPNFVLPQGTEQEWRETLRRIEQEITLDDISNLPQFFGTITPILDKSYPQFKQSPLWKTAYPYYLASESLMDYANGFWSQEQTLSDGYVNISALLDDRKRLHARLVEEVGLSPTGASMLLKVMDSSPDVIIKISAMTSDSFARTVCDVNGVKKLFSIEQTAFFLSQQMCSKNPQLLKDLITRQYDIKNLVHQIENPWMQVDSFSFSQYAKVQDKFMKHIQNFLSSSGVVWDNNAWERYLGTVANAGSHLADLADQMRQIEKNRFGPLMDGVVDQMYYTGTGQLFQSAVKNLGLVFNAAKSGATNVDSFYVDLQSVLKPRYSLAQFLTKTYDQVPLFVEAFSNTKVNALMVLSRSRSLAWGDFCRDQKLGPLFKFNSSIDTEMLARSLCNTNYESIEAELTKQIDLNRVEQQLVQNLETLTTGPMINSITQLLKSSVTEVTGKSKSMNVLKDSAMLNVEGEMLMRDIHSISSTKQWPALKQRMTLALQSIGVVLYNSTSLVALQNYANTVKAISDSLKSALESRNDHEKIVTLGNVLKNETDMRWFLEHNLHTSDDVIEILFNSKIHAYNLWNMETLCTSASLSQDAFVSLDALQKNELEALLCQLHFPMLLRQLQSQVVLSNGPVVLSLSGKTKEVNLEAMLDDLQYLSNNIEQIRKLWPDKNVLQLLDVQADLTTLIQDYNANNGNMTSNELINRNLLAFVPRLKLKDQPIESSEVLAHVKSLNSLLATVQRAIEEQTKPIGSLEDIIVHPKVFTQQLRDFGLDSDLINMVMHAKISIKTLASLATSQGRRQICDSGPLNFLVFDETVSNETQQYIENFLCQKDMKNFTVFVFQNINIDALTQKNVPGALDVSYLLGNTGELLQIIESLANGADPTTLQSLIDTSKIYQVLDKHINGLGSISPTARSLLDNARSFDYITMALIRALAPLAAVNLDIESIVSRDELVDELVTRLLNSSQQMAGAMLAEDIAYKSENFPEYASQLFESVCNYSTLEMVLQSKVNLHSAPAPIHQLSNNLCNAQVSQWFALASEALGSDENARIALKSVQNHYIQQVNIIDPSMDLSTKSAPVDLMVLTKHLNSLRQILTTLQGPLSWQSSVRRFLDAIANMPEERGSRVAQKLTQIITIFNSADEFQDPELFETDSNSIYRRLKDETFRAAQIVIDNGGRPAGDFRIKPLSDDVGWQNSVKKLASTFGSVLDGQLGTNYMSNSANTLWKIFKGNENGRFNDILDACYAIPAGSYERNKVDQLSDYSRLVSEQLRKFPIYKKAVCDLPKMGVKDLYETAMYELGWAQTGEMLQNIGRSRRDIPMATCEQYMESIVQLWSAMYNVMVEMQGEGGRQLAFCIKQADTDAFKTIDRYLELASGVSSIVNTPGTAGGMMSLRPAFQDFAGMIDRYMPVYAPFKNYLLDSEKLDYDLSVLEVPGSTRAALLSAEIDLNFVSTLNNADELQTALCTSTKTKRLLKLPSSVVWIDWHEFTALLCANRAEQISENVYSVLDMDRIRKEVPGLKQKQMQSPSWFLDVSQNGARMAEDISKLSENGGKLLRDFTSGEMDVSQALYQMQYGYDFSMMKRMAEELVGNAGKLLGASPFVDDLQKVLDGIGGLDVLQKLSARMLKDPYTVDEIFLASNETKNFLLNEVGLTLPEVERIMSSDISLKGALESLEVQYDDFCDANKLKRILESAEDEALVSELSTKLCLVQPEVLANFTRRLFTKIDPTLLIGRFIRGSVERKLEKSGLTPIEAADTVDRMKRLPSLLPLLQDGLQDEMSYVAHLKMSNPLVFDSVPYEESTPKQETENPVGYVGEMFCGKRIKNTLDKLKFSKLVKSFDPDAEYQITEKDETEMKQLKTDFCRNVYLKLVSIGDVGSIFWSFLKPVLLGEIAIVPNTVEAREISRLANTTFNDLADWFRMVQFGSEIVNEMTDLKKDPNKFHDLQQLLRHPLLRNSFQEALFIDSVDLAASLEQGKMLDPELKVKLEQLANTVKNLSQCINMDRFRFYRNEQELNIDLEKKIKKRHLLAAVIFTNLGSGRYQRNVPTSISNVQTNIKLPKHLKYRIRMPAGLVPNTINMREQIWGGGSSNFLSSSTPYLYGFIQLQDMIDNAILKLHANPTLLATEEIGIYARQLPYPCHQNDIFVGHIKHWLPIIMMAAWLITFGCLINHGVTETDHKLSQVLRVCGLKSSIQWTGWFIVSTLFSSLACLTVALLLKFTSILTVTNWFIVVIYLMAFCFSMSMMSFLVRCFFSKPQLASLNGIIIYLMACLPYLVPSQLEQNFGATLKIVLSLSAPSAFLFGTQYMTSWEATGTGLQWENMGTLIQPTETLSFMAYFVMLFVDAFIYGAIAVLISNKKFNKNSFASNIWNFCLKCSCKSTQLNDTDVWKDDDSATMDFDMIDNDEDDDETGVKVNGLTKIFDGEGKAGVKNLRFCLKKGQITTLLGQNGAGKTTTIKLLTGIESPDQGSVQVFGVDIFGKAYNSTPRSIGLCPQENALFDRLTVKEHLKYFGMLKGTLSNDELEIDIQSLLNDTQLVQYQNVQVRYLSGGMKRRLCVGLAFVAGSKLVILDEPTAGVDPVARRAIWDIVIKNKHQRTVLFCTHYLDEAEIISDRLAIMQEGKIIGMGTSEHLKEKFGCGYKLMVVKNSELEPLSSAIYGFSNTPTDLKSLLKFIKKYADCAEVIDSYGLTASISLPVDQRQNRIPEMVSALEVQKEQFGIASFGISGSTLEEVFMTTCKSPDKKGNWNKVEWPKHRRSSQQDIHSSIQENSAGESDCESGMIKSNGKVVFSLSDDNTARHEGCRLKLSQFTGIMVKRFHHCRRDWKLQFSGLFLPCLFVLMAMGFSQLRPKSVASPSLALAPEWYINDGQIAFMANLNPSNDQLMKLSKAFASNGFGKGLGSTCFLDSDPVLRLERECHQVEEGFATNYINENDRQYFSGSAKQCQCSYGKQICPLGAEGVIAPRMYTNTSGILYDLTDVAYQLPLSTYLINTFQKTHESRYGGWSFNEDLEKGKPALRSDIWFETAGIHALPTFFNGLSNMRLRSQKDENTADEYAITTYNHPFDLQPDDLSSESLKQKLADVGIGLVLLCAFSFIPAALVIYVVQERVHKERHIQSLSGVGPWLYWSSSLLWDMLIYLLTLIMASIIVAVFKVPSFTAHTNLPATMLLITLYGLSSLPLMYFLQRWFNDGMAAYLLLFGGSVFIGMNTLACNMLLDLFSWAYNFESARKITSAVFLIFPQFCLAGGLVELTKNQILNEIYESIGKGANRQSPFSLNVIGYHCLCLTIQSVFFFLLTIAADFCNAPDFLSFTRRSKCSTEADVVKDNDVLAERSAVHNSESGNAANSNVLRIDDLHKVYSSTIGGDLVAVNKLCLAIKKGECFGLLGLNGAGKTSTFRMLTGDLKPSEGNAYLAGSRLTGRKYQAQHDLGYCPQEDACDQLLTTKEQLDFYARLKGYHKSAVPSVTQYWLRRFSLENYINQTIQSLSGGTRRKICVASALVGRPRLVLLDEPTAGMDIGTRRIVWREVQSILNEGRSVLLTSHSMQECDVLCSRLAIMVNGSLHCLGTPPALKEKFGDGYTLRLKAANSESLQAVEECLKTQFPCCNLREKHYCSAEYVIPRSGPSIRIIFAKMEALKQRRSVLHYSITQTSLDQVFVSFAKLQCDGGEISRLNAEYSNPALVDDSQGNAM